MGNLFSVKPDLPEIVLPRTWTCPITGLVVPKVPEMNLRWRAELLAEAEKNPDIQVDLYTACSQSVLFFINVFVFTLRVFEPSKDGRVQQAENAHLPFVTWPIQDEHILKLEHCIDEGESMLTDKSRDMGATWDHIAMLVHRFLFRPDESHLMISRKEDAVDGLSGLPKGYPFGPLADPGTLFGKIDYILNRLPEWMLPRMARKSMHLINLDNHTRIDGESSNATAGSSDRRTSIFLDEMAKMKEAEAIKQSTKDVTACRLPCSTPNGAGTAYSKWRMSGTIPVFVLPWWEHPEKGRGRYVAQDELGRFRIRSPWYDRRCEEDSPKEIATELDMDHVGSGDTFFEGNILEQHKKLFVRPPKRRMNIRFKKNTADDAIPEILRKRELARVSYGDGKQWRVWVELAKGRPDQSKSYTLGVDIGKGQGASNSVISILCNETLEKIAEFADANTPPYELARIAAAAGLWCGGRNRFPLCIWENNGDPGFDFGRHLVHVLNYPHIYFDRKVGDLREKAGKRYGWRSTPEKKAVALGILRRAYAHSKFINHSEESLVEAGEYIHYEGGGIGPAALVNESEATRKAHGDRVIADMLTLVGRADAPKYRKSELAPGSMRTIGGRMRAYLQAKKDRRRKDRFDFTQEAAYAN